MKKTICTICLAALLGCTSSYTEPDNAFNKKVDDSVSKANDLLERKSYTVSKQPSLAVSKKPVSISDRAQSILKGKTVSVEKGSGSVPLAAILQSLNEQGVNVTSQIDLDRYRYSGFSINATDAITALEILTGTLGLDFIVENMSNGSPLVYISALTAETRVLNIGPRNVTSSMGTNSLGGSNVQQQQQSGSATDLQVGSTTISSGATAEISSKVEDDFWVKLKEELEERLRRPIPRIQPKSTLDTFTQESTVLYDLVKLGHVVINSSTGAITVMAPRTIRKEIMEYLDRVAYQLNSTVILRGQVIVVSNSNQKSEGIDWSGIKGTGEGSLAIGNDVLGNTVISLPGELADIVAGNALAPSLIGYQRADQVLRIFNGYLSRDNRTQTLQTPVASTTSGVPVNLTDIQNDFQIIVNTDRTTSEGGTTNTGVTNNILTFQYGTNLTLTPRYDIEKDIIRTDVNLQLKIKQGDKALNQLVSGGSSPELSEITLPLIKELNYQGQALLKPGEVIVMGGQTVELFEEDNGGITGLKDGVLGGIFGSRKENKSTVTYYFLLSAYAVPYGA